MVYLDIRGSPSFVEPYLVYGKETYISLEQIPKSETILTQSDETYNLCKNYGYSVQYLSEYLGMNPEFGLYEIFSTFFDGKIRMDSDMVDAIFNGLIYDSDWCFCLKLGATFCWFTISGGSCIKRGTMQFSEPVSRYSVGKFIKRLRYSIAVSGINLKRVKYLVWSDEDVGYAFRNYILKYDRLEDFFRKIDGLRNLSCVNVMQLLSKHIQLKYHVSAENFVDCLNDSSKALGINEVNGILYSSNVYYKDYSSCVSPVFDMSGSTYGVVLDCEGAKGGNGSLENGCSEIGGLIFCRYKNILLGLSQFSCDEVLLEETLVQVISNYREFSFSKFKVIDVITFGSSDSVMLLSSIRMVCSKVQAKRLISQFRFIDSRSLILDHAQGVDGRETLTNLARSFNVMPVIPKHRALSDARTLFNILAKILYETGDFVV